MKTDNSRKALSPNHLVNRHLVAPLINQLQNLTSIPTPHFELFYRAPLIRFLKLTEHSSETEIVTHLEAVVRALKLRRSMILPLNSDAESINKQKDLWSYAIFVAATMFNATALIAANQIIVEDKGVYRKWNPFEGSIPENCQYKILGKAEISAAATNALLPLVFCGNCISWLYRDNNVFNTTMTLTHNPWLIPRLGDLILTAHKIIAPQKNSENNDTKLQEKDDLTRHEKTKSPKTSVKIEAKISFVTWLTSCIKNQKYTQHICETLDGHALADPLIFEQYCKDAGLLASAAKEERNAFFQLGVHNESPRMNFSGANKKAFIVNVNQLSTDHEV